MVNDYFFGCLSTKAALNGYREAFHKLRRRGYLPWDWDLQEERFARLFGVPKDLMSFIKLIGYPETPVV